MKRALPANSSATKAKVKRKKPAEPEYTSTTPERDESGEIIWPAPAEQIAEARRIIHECAAANKKTVIAPDKDADGLSSGAILQKTLVLLGLAPDNIIVHLLVKGTTIHSDSERELLNSHDPAYLFVLDHGSRQAPRLVDSPHTTTLVIDHHFASPDDIPAGSRTVNACHSPPVATSALLTYEICKTLHNEVAAQTAWLCCIGTHGDLGNTLKWNPPFPDMAAVLKAHTKKSIHDAISLLNAPRRTSTYDVRLAWDALIQADAPKDILGHPRLLAARAEINREVERCTHTAPRFSRDATIAVFTISSPCQVHPLIATRWAAHLSSKKLEIVMVANTGYLPGMVHFSCRIARVARARTGAGASEGTGGPVDIIARLKKEAAAHESGDLLQRMGDDFARGHVQASGGIVREAEFADLMSVLRVGEKPDAPATPTKKGGSRPLDASPQKNTLNNYFKVG